MTTGSASLGSGPSAINLASELIRRGQPRDFAASLEAQRLAYSLGIGPGATSRLVGQLGFTDNLENFVTYWIELVEAGTKNPLVYDNLGVANARDGEKGEAINWFLEGTRLLSEFSATHLAITDYDGAFNGPIAEALTSAVDRGSGLAANALGMYWLRHGDEAAARDAWQVGKRLRDHNSAGHLEYQPVSGSMPLRRCKGLAGNVRMLLHVGYPLLADRAMDLLKYTAAELNSAEAAEAAEASQLVAETLAAIDDAKKGRPPLSMSTLIDAALNL